MCMRTACPKDKPEFNIFLLVVFTDLLRSTWSQLLYSYLRNKINIFLLFSLRKIAMNKSRRNKPCSLNFTAGATFSCKAHHPVSLLNSFCPDLKNCGHPDDNTPATVLAQLFVFFLKDKGYAQAIPHSFCTSTTTILYVYNFCSHISTVIFVTEQSYAALISIKCRESHIKIGVHTALNWRAFCFDTKNCLVKFEYSLR